MIPINLLPAHHRARLRASGALRRWSAFTAFYATALVVIILAAHLVCTVDDRSVTAELEHLQDQSARLEKIHTASLTQLQAIQVQTSLRDAVNSPPDFAALLAAIATSCGDDALLTSLKWDNIPVPQVLAIVASPATPDPTAIVDPLAGSAGIKVELAGLARAQPGVGLVVQRLQNTNLFDDVRLTKTSREGFLAGDALSFHLACVIDPAARHRSMP